MARLCLILVLVSLAIHISGCQGAKEIPLPTVNQDHLPLIAHPEFANWNQFSVGTEIERVDTLASSDSTVLLYTKIRLAEKSDQQVIIETQTAIERGGVREDSDLNRVEYPAQFRVPEGMQPEQFELPALKAQKVGEETLEVDGQEIATEVFTFKDQSEAGPVDVKLWRSASVPGRQVKKEIVDGTGAVLSASRVAHISIP